MQDKSSPILKNLLKQQNILILCAIIIFNFTFMKTAASAGLFSSLLPTYTIAGKVIDQNQVPLAGVTVVFVCDGIGGKFSTVTDDMGNYVLHPVAGSSGTLTLKMDTYRIIREVFPNYLTQSGRQNIKNYTLYPDWFSGKVTDQSGTPLEGVKINFEQDGGLNGVATVFTDENGNYKYTISNDTGSYRTYWVTISKDGYKLIRGRLDFVIGGKIFNFTLQQAQ